MSVNDAFVMGAWGRDQKTGGKVRMMADGSADFAKATGLTLDLTARGMGLRSQRYSMLVKDGVVKTLNIEAPGKFEVSDADDAAGAGQGARSGLQSRRRFDSVRPVPWHNRTASPSSLLPCGQPPDPPKRSAVQSAARRAQD